MLLISFSIPSPHSLPYNTPPRLHFSLQGHFGRFWSFFYNEGLLPIIRPN
ncbi:hypothetical protein Hanom_Chr10g00878411 [Helianthus anomalus]